MDNTVYKKKICMTELHIGKMKFDRPQYFDAKLGQKNSTFIFVAKGKLTISTVGKSISVDEGGLLFIPEGMRYNAVWRGTPDIEYYSLRIISKKTDITDTASGFALQRVDLFEPNELQGRIDEIYNLFITGERTKLIRAVGLYYCLYAEILPHLHKEKLQKYNPAVVAAINYIDANYTEDTSIDKLAAICHVSPSRLYHLFRSELHTTPVKYRNSLRVGHAAAELRSSELGIDEIAGHHGFNSAAYFRETFKAETGLTPTEYRTVSRQVEAGK